MGLVQHGPGPDGRGGRVPTVGGGVGAGADRRSGVLRQGRGEAECLIPCQRLGGAAYDGFGDPAKSGLLGMITLRGDLDLPAAGRGGRRPHGHGAAGARRIVGKGDRRVRLDVAGRIADRAALCRGGRDVLHGSTRRWPGSTRWRSTCRMRARCSASRGRGARAGADEALSRSISPQLAPGELRRTRAAQVACAFWHDGRRTYTAGLVSARSPAMSWACLRKSSARPGSESLRRPDPTEARNRPRNRTRKSALTFRSRAHLFTASAFTNCRKDESDGFHPSRSSVCP